MRARATQAAVAMGASDALSKLLGEGPGQPRPVALLTDEDGLEVAADVVEG